MIYLASPYNHADPEIREQRFRSACLAAAFFMRQGLYVFSPIAHTHPIAVAGDLPRGWDYWREYDWWFIRNVGEIRVLMLPGWNESTGVQGEIDMAEDLATPVTYWGWRGADAVQFPGGVFSDQLEMGV